MNVMKQIHNYKYIVSENIFTLVIYMDAVFDNELSVGLLFTLQALLRLIVSNHLQGLIHLVLINVSDLCKIEEYTPLHEILGHLRDHCSKCLNFH